MKMKSINRLILCILIMLVANTIIVLATNVTFNSTVIYNKGLDNCSIYTNSTGTWALSGVNKTVIANDTDTAIAIVAFTSVGRHIWNTECCFEGVCGFATDNFTFKIANTVNVDFNYTPVSQTGLFDNCSLYTNDTERWERRKINSTLVVNDTLNTFTYNLSMGHYRWNVGCCLEGLCGFADGNFTVIVGDLTPSNITTVTLNSPTNGFKFNTTHRVTFNCSVNNPSGLDNVTFYRTDSTNTGFFAINTTSILGFNSTSAAYTDTLGRGNYSWNCYGCNTTSNCAFASANYSLEMQTQYLNSTNSIGPMGFIDYQPFLANTSCVEPNGSSATNHTFSVRNDDIVNGSITVQVNATQAGYTMICGPSYNCSSMVNVTTATNNVTIYDGLVVGETQNVWCFINYSQTNNLTWHYTIYTDLEG